MHKIFKIFQKLLYFMTAKAQFQLKFFLLNHAMQLVPNLFINEYFYVILLYFKLNYFISFYCSELL